MPDQTGRSTFTLGALAGIAGGFVLGVALGQYVIETLALLWSTLTHRGRGTDDERLRRDLLLQ